MTIYLLGFKGKHIGLYRLEELTTLLSLVALDNVELDGLTISTSFMPTPGPIFISRINKLLKK